MLGSCGGGGTTSITSASQWADLIQMVPPPQLPSIIDELKHGMALAKPAKTSPLLSCRAAKHLAKALL